MQKPIISSSPFHPHSESQRQLKRLCWRASSHPGYFWLIRKQLKRCADTILCAVNVTHACGPETLWLQIANRQPVSLMAAGIEFVVLHACRKEHERWVFFFFFVQWWGGANAVITSLMDISVMSQTCTAAVFSNRQQ